MNTVPLPLSIAPKPSTDLNIELVNVEKKYNLNDIFSGEVKSYNIISDPGPNIDLNIHILTFKPRQINVYYIVSVQASNTWGVNTFNFNVTEYAQMRPSLINYSNLDIQLSNQSYNFDYTHYFSGLMQEFYIVSNPGTIIQTNNNIFTISTQLYAFSEYDIVLGVSNVYGSNEFTLHVTNYKQTYPEFINNDTSINIELLNVPFKLYFSDMYSGIIENINIFDDTSQNSRETKE